MAQSGNFRTAFYLTASGLAFLALGPANAQLMVRPGAMVLGEADIPPPVISNAPKDAVILRSARADTVIGAAPVLRTTPLAGIRANPMVKLGSDQLDFRPMLENPRAPFNVAAQLRANPQLATVIADETSTYEISNGLIIHSLVTYRLRPGVCSSNVRSTALAKAGAECARPQSDSEFAAAFARPGDPHYVSEARLRGPAIAEAQAKRQKSKAELDADLAELRGALASPTRRASLSQEIGASETTRLASLSDDQLMAEMVNAGETTVEQTYYIPRADKPALSRYSAMRPTVQKSGILGGLQTVINGGPINPKESELQLSTVVGKKRDLEPRLFLTGFTLGKNYEWRQRVAKTVGWCKVACKKYHVEVYAGFSYGFGLRFAMRMNGQYEYRSENGLETARLTTQFEPIDGSAQDFADAGLAGNQLFDGKELVAEAGAYAGASYKLPTLGSASVDFKVGVDFTSDLPAPYTNGQFKPPAPGEQGIEPMTKVFDQIDLIGGRASFGIAGAKVFPALQAQLTSDKLEFRLRDLVSGKTAVLAAPGGVTDLAIRASDHGSSFTLGDPSYNLSFLTTPGLDARLYIDVYVWSHTWDWPVWFPQLAIKLPPGGAAFGCHAGTVCTRAYAFSPDGQTESNGPPSNAAIAAQQWENGFLNAWLPQCSNDGCRDGIKALAKSTAEKLLALYTAKTSAAHSGPLGTPNVGVQMQKDFEIQQAQLNASIKAKEIVDGPRRRTATPTPPDAAPTPLPTVSPRVRPGVLRIPGG